MSTPESMDDIANSIAFFRLFSPTVARVNFDATFNAYYRYGLFLLFPFIESSLLVVWIHLNNLNNRLPFFIANLLTDSGAFNYSIIAMGLWYSIFFLLLRSFAEILNHPATFFEALVFGYRRSSSTNWSQSHDETRLVLCNVDAIACV